MIYEQNPTKLFDSDSESCDTVPCNDTDDEYSVSARVVLQEEEEAIRENNEEGFSVPTGVVPFAAAGEEEEEFYDSEECQVGEEQEEEYDVYYDAQQYEEGEDEEVEESEDEEEEEEFLISNDISAYSEMSIGMDVYNNGVDEIAAVKGEMQVEGSGCGWYPIIDEDIEMEDVPYIDVEMLDADEEVYMLLVEDEDVEMEEAADMMDVDGEFW
ncbi:unnamed protein product [Mucor circinelloides]